MKNRKRETCTSGTVRDEDGNILIYSEDRKRGGVAGGGAGATAGAAYDRAARCWRSYVIASSLSDWGLIFMRQQFWRGLSG